MNIEEGENNHTTSEVVHDLCKVHLTIMIEKAINNQDQDQDHQRGKVHLTMVLKNAVNDQDHQKEKDTIEVDHTL